jgi:TRAP-type C4-dicarboxylate transport system permease small subunit
MVSEPVHRSAFEAGVARLSDAMGVAGAVLLIAMLLIVVVNVVMRYAFNSPIIWADQVATYGVVYVTFIGAPRVLARRGHVAVDILESMLSATGRRVLMVFIDAVGLLYCAAFTLLAGREIQRIIARGAQFSDAFTVSQWVVYIVIPVGSALLALQFLAHLVGSLGALRRAARSPSPT